MKRDSLIFAVSGAFFGLLVGWVLGSQHGGTPLIDRTPAAAPPPAQTASPATGSAPAPIDERRVEELRAAALQDARDPRPREELGNVYFDAERYDEAVRWYEEALSLDADNIDVSTDLGVCYYYLNQPERALAQFARSLDIDPYHAKTLLNTGIVRAFGMQDLAGASEAWRQVVEIAPESPEGRAARQALESMTAAHPEATGSAPGGSLD